MRSTRGRGKRGPIVSTAGPLAAALSALSALSATPAAAQSARMPTAGPERHLVRVGFGGGMSVPTRRAANALKQGINGQGYLLISPGMLPPIRLNVGYQKFDYKRTLLGAALPGTIPTTPGGTPTEISGDTQILSGVAGLSVNLFRIGPIRPYLTAGLGAFNIRDAIDTGSGTTSTSELRYGVDGGGGIAIKLGRLEAFIEGRVQNVYTERGVIDTKTIQSVPVTFGILF